MADDEDPKVQMNVQVHLSRKRAAQRWIEKTKTLDGETLSLSMLVDKMLEWFLEAEK